MATTDEDECHGRPPWTSTDPTGGTTRRSSAAALAATAADATEVLVVGPGRGEELPGLLRALPGGRFTLVEPSAAMVEACGGVLTTAGAVHRCRVLTGRLEDCDELRSGTFEAVVALNVLHLLSPQGQEALQRQLAAAVAPGGSLLISGYSEDPDPTTDALLLAVARSRLLQLGTEPLTVERLLASRGASVFGIAADRLEQVLTAAGLDTPRCLLQPLTTRLWLSRRPDGNGAAPTAADDGRHQTPG